MRPGTTVGGFDPTQSQPSADQSHDAQAAMQSASMSQGSYYQSHGPPPPVPQYPYQVPIVQGPPPLPPLPALAAAARPWPMAGPPPSAPSAHQFPVSTYNPLAYGPMPGAYQPPVSPTGPSYTSSSALPPATHASVSGAPQSTAGSILPQGPPHRWSMHPNIPPPTTYGRPSERSPQQSIPERPDSMVNGGASHSPISLVAPGSNAAMSRPTSVVDQGPPSQPSSLLPVQGPPYHHRYSANPSPPYPPEQYKITPGPPQPAYHPVPIPASYSIQAQTVSVSSKPPPPLPPGYQAEMRWNQHASPPHPPYSHLPPTHRYEPPDQPNSPPSSVHPPHQEATLNMHRPPSTAYRSYGQARSGRPPLPPPPPPSSSPPLPPAVPPKTLPAFLGPGAVPHQLNPHADRPSLGGPPAAPGPTVLRPSPWSSGVPPVTGPGSPNPPVPSPPDHHLPPHMTSTWVPTPEPSVAGSPPPPATQVSPVSTGRDGGIAAPPVPSYFQVGSTDVPWSTRRPGEAPPPPSRRSPTAAEPAPTSPFQPTSREHRVSLGAQRPPSERDGQHPRFGPASDLSPSPRRGHAVPRDQRHGHDPSKSASGSHEISPRRIDDRSVKLPVPEGSGARNSTLNAALDGATVPPRPSVPGDPPAPAVQVHSHGHRMGDVGRDTAAEEAHATPIITPSSGPPRSSVSDIRASILGGIGAPSDWEHFGLSTEGEGTPEAENNDQRAATSNGMPAAGLAELDSASSSTRTGPPDSPPRAGPLELRRVPTQPAPLRPRHLDSSATGDRESSTPSTKSERPVSRPPSPPPPPPPADDNKLCRTSSGLTESTTSGTPTPSSIPARILTEAMLAWAEPTAPLIGFKPDERLQAAETSQIQRSNQQSLTPSSSPPPPPPQPVEDGLVEQSKEPNLTRPVPGSPTTDETTEKGPIAGGPFPLSWYDELDERFKASVQRYAAMVRAASQTTTVEEQLRMFGDFIGREPGRIGFVSNPAPYHIHPSNDDESQFQVPEVTTRKASGAYPAPGLPSVVAKDRPTPIHVSSYLAVQDVDEEQYSPGGRPVLRPVAFHPGANVKRGDLPVDVKSSSSSSSLKNDVDPAPPSPGENAPIPISSADPGSARSLDHRPRSDSLIQESREEPQSSYQSSGSNQILGFTDRNEQQRGLFPRHKAIQPGFGQGPDPTLSPTSPDLGGVERKRCSEPHPRLQGQSEVGSPGIEVSSAQSPSPELDDRRHQNVVDPGGSLEQTGDRYHNLGHGGAREKATAPSSTRAVELPTLMFDLHKLLSADRHSTSLESESLTAIECAVEVIPDDYGFLDHLLTSWEAEAKSLRDVLRKERQQRQEEHRAFAERLFSESQVSYADLNAMEDDFQGSEATKEAQEQEGEYYSYAQKVFDAAYAQLQKQIKDLMEQYVPLMDLMKNSPEGLRHERSQLGRIIDLLLHLHRRIENRHDKVLQVILERDQRFQRAMLYPLYSSNETSKLHEYEKHFQEAATKTRLEACVTKAQRAERLAQAIEQSVGRGVNEEFHHMKEIKDEITRVSDALLSENRQLDDGEALAVRHELESARQVLSALSSAAERLMYQSYMASLIHHAARQDRSVASADTPNASSEVLSQQLDVKAKADDRLQHELDRQVSPIRRDIERILDQIEKILDHLNRK